jgi:hypothetical protein
VCTLLNERFLTVIKRTHSYTLPALQSLIFDKISEKVFFLLTPQTPNSVSHTTFHPSSIKIGSFFFSSSSLRNYGLGFSSTLSAFLYTKLLKNFQKNKISILPLSNSIPILSYKISLSHINPALLLLQKFSIAHERFTCSSHLKIWPKCLPTQRL